MFAKLTSADRNRLAVASIVLAVIVFVAINVFTDLRFTSARLDLTEDGLYTLSDGTRAVLASIDEPITLRYYASGTIEKLGPVYTAHAARVSDMLDEYARLSGGMIRVERYDPQPFSPEEDLAVGDGLRGIALGAGGSQLYFGIAGSNATDDVTAIPYLAPERGRFLEYDLTRLVYDLSRPEKTKVAVMGDLPVVGSQYDGFKRWKVLDSMAQFFDLSFLYGSIDRIDDSVDVIFLAQPDKLDQKTLYAIDQFVMRGGRVLAFIDPYAEVVAAQRPKPTKADAIAAVEPLFKAWGVEIPKNELVGDAVTASRVQVTQGGRNVITDYPVWIGLVADSLARDDVVTAELKQINMKSAGLIRARKGATTTIEPLITSSDQAMTIAAEKIRLSPDPIGLMRDFKPSGERYVLAARVSGPVKSAFPDGPPQEIEDQALRDAYRSEAETPLNMILVADADLLADRSWLQVQSLLGQQYAVPIANNGDFAINALDNLGGTQGLISLRGRGLERRPFAVIERMTRDATAKYRATEQDLTTQIQTATKKIQDLQRQGQEAGVMLTAAQQKAIDDFRVKVLDLRARLREVQRALRVDVDRLETRIRVLDIWAMPLLVGAVALGLALIRRRRRARFHHRHHLADVARAEGARP